MIRNGLNVYLATDRNVIRKHDRVDRNKPLIFEAVFKDEGGGEPFLTLIARSWSSLEAAVTFKGVQAMRSSKASLLLVIVIASMACLETGCVGSRLGKNISNISVPRPRLLSWRKSRSNDTDLAKRTPRPPASSIPPSGDRRAMADSGSRSFQSEPAPGSNYDRSSGYVSTGDGGSYGGTNSIRGSADNARNEYVASSGPNSQPQRGFYGSQYQGTGGASSAGQGAYDDEYARSGFGARSEAYGDTGGASSEYGGAYASDAGAGGYQRVADRTGGYGYGARGSDNRNAANAGSQYGGAQNDGSQGASFQYGSSQSSGSQYDGSRDGSSQQSGSNFSGSQYDSSQYGGGSGRTTTNGYDDSRYLSPQSSGGSSYDDRRNPAPNNYDSGASSSSYTGNYGGQQGAQQGASNPADTSSAAGASWFPGSSKPYNPKPITPSTNNGYGGSNGW